VLDLLTGSVISQSQDIRDWAVTKQRHFVVSSLAFSVPANQYNGVVLTTAANADILVTDVRIGVIGKSNMNVPVAPSSPPNGSWIHSPQLMIVYKELPAPVAGGAISAFCLDRNIVAVPPTNYGLTALQAYSNAASPGVGDFWLSVDNCQGGTTPNSRATPLIRLRPGVIYFFGHQYLGPNPTSPDAGIGTQVTWLNIA